MTTALWRGYVATFEIKDNVLYLKDLRIMVADSLKTYGWKSVLEDTLGTILGGMEIKWFTGLLVLPHGKLVNYVHYGTVQAIVNIFCWRFMKED